MTNDSILYQFKNKLVRELAWAIVSPPLITGQDFLPHEWFLEKFQTELPFLQQLDNDPSSIENFLTKRQPKRLGKYFETLYEFWFTHSKQFSLLEANLQVQDGKNTLGELDFIVKDLATNIVLHLEIAVKFYLQNNDGETYSQWIGPNTKDRLSIKYQKMVGKQLRMSDHEYVRDRLSAKGVRSIQSKAIMKGFFFYNPSWSFKFNNGFHPNLPTAFRSHFSDFLNQDFTTSHFLLLEKIDWFSVPDLFQNTTMNYCELRNFAFQRMAVLPNPFMVIERKPEANEWTRWMVIPDSWPEFAF